MHSTGTFFVIWTRFVTIKNTVWKWYILLQILNKTYSDTMKFFSNKLLNLFCTYCFFLFFFCFRLSLPIFFLFPVLLWTLIFSLKMPISPGANRGSAAAAFQRQVPARWVLPTLHTLSADIVFASTRRVPVLSSQTNCARFLCVHSNKRCSFFVRSIKQTVLICFVFSQTNGARLFCVQSN